MKLYALVVTAVIGTAVAIERNNASLVVPPDTELAADRMGQVFLQYRTAVATFQRQNPSFTGSVSSPALSALGFQFPQDFLNVAGNAITATGVSGRVVTSYGVLPAGAGTVARKAADGDASLGVVSGPNWTSYASGVSTPLATAVPNGAVVSVIQIGK